jgi:lipid-A-disaccharide synthase
MFGQDLTKIKRDAPSDVGGACYKARAVAPELLIVATEASADLHAARVLEELRALVPGLAAFGMGGPRLRAAGLEALHRAEEMSVMGIGEVLPKIPVILGILRDLAAAALARRPAVALLVDSPDFNLRLAKRLKRAGVKVVYYVSPSVWAWRRGRVKTIARVVDRMLCILPFEERFYAGTGVSARFVGHPLAETPRPGPASAYRARLGLAAGRTTVALLPGSRRSEVKRIFPAMLDAAERIRARHPDAQFVVPVAPGIGDAALRGALARHATLEVTLAPGATDAALGAADAALVKSGTSVLETALMLRPMVVVYRLSWLSYVVGRLFVKLAHFALVNLLAGRAVVPELLQRDATGERMAAELEPLLPGGTARDEQLRGLEEVRTLLGEPGAPRRVAEEIVRMFST